MSAEPATTLSAVRPVESADMYPVTLKAGESVKERLYRRALDRCTDEVRRALGRSGDASTRVEDVPDDWLENVAAPEAVEDRVCGCCVSGRPAPWRGAGGAAR